MAERGVENKRRKKTTMTKDALLLLSLSALCRRAQTPGLRRSCLRRSNGSGMSWAFFKAAQPVNVFFGHLSTKTNWKRLEIFRFLV
jgi:hypothetical protein